MKPSIIPQVYADTIANGGGTFRPDGSQPSRGFAVAVNEGSFAIVDIDDRLAFEDAINAVAESFGDVHIGTWVHEGRIHIDPVYLTQDRGEASLIATAYKQLAYYVIHEQREVYV